MRTAARQRTTDRRRHAALACGPRAGWDARERRPSVAWERRPGFGAGGGGDAAGAGGEGDAAGSGGDSDPVVDLTALVAAVVEIDVDELGEEAIRSRLVGIERTIRQLTGLRARWQGILETRAAAAARPGREGQAIRQVRSRTVDELRLTPSEVKRAGETGRRIEAHPAAAAAMTAGDLPPAHAKVLTDTLRWFTDVRTRADVEAQLLAAATEQDAVTFGRTARRLLAELDSRSAQAAEDRRRGRRYVRVAQTPDGMTVIHGGLAGLGAEALHTALHAFTTEDAPGQRRRPEQRAADALVTICETAMRAGEAPSQHGIRPHILITVAEPTVADRDGTGAGSCEAAWTGPLPWTEARRLLADAGVSRVLLDPAEAPTRAGVATRTVPAGLWKLLLVRHRTCAGDGCTVPASWGQAMHLDTPYRLQGRLGPDNSAPGCSFHHRMLDHQGWQVTWVDGAPVVHHPRRPPRSLDGGPDPGARPDPGPDPGGGPDRGGGPDPGGGPDRGGGPDPGGGTSGGGPGGCAGGGGAVGFDRTGGDGPDVRALPSGDAGPDVRALPSGGDGPDVRALPSGGDGPDVRAVPSGDAGPRPDAGARSPGRSSNRAGRSGDARRRPDAGGDGPGRGAARSRPATRAGEPGAPGGDRDRDRDRGPTGTADASGAPRTSEAHGTSGAPATSGAPVSPGAPATSGVPATSGGPATSRVHRTSGARATSDVPATSGAPGASGVFMPDASVEPEGPGQLLLLPTSSDRTERGPPP